MAIYMDFDGIKGDVTTEGDVPTQGDVTGGDVTTGLAQPRQFVGYRGDAGDPTAVVLKHNGLHIEIVFDRSSRIGQDDPAGVADVLLEAAITTIQDCEDSISAVDADDKVAAYRNWLGLMRGTLSASFEKGGEQMERLQLGIAVFAGEIVCSLDGFLRFDSKFVPTDGHGGPQIL